MAAHPVLRFHNGRLDVPEQLQRDWKLQEGSELRILSSSPDHILLECSKQAAPDFATTMALLDSLRGSLSLTVVRLSGRWKPRLVKSVPAIASTSSIDLEPHLPQN